jgi:predicted CopG family antitoxin
MKRITITIEESIYDKLPKYGKSGAINVILKHHYQKEGADQLYQTIKQRLMKDQDIDDWIAEAVRLAGRYN